MDSEKTKSERDLELQVVAISEQARGAEIHGTKAVGLGNQAVGSDAASRWWMLPFACCFGGGGGGAPRPSAVGHPLPSKLKEPQSCKAGPSAIQGSLGSEQQQVSGNPDVQALVSFPFDSPQHTWANPLDGLEQRADLHAELCAGEGTKPAAMKQAGQEHPHSCSAPGSLPCPAQGTCQEAGLMKDCDTVLREHASLSPRASAASSAASLDIISGISHLKCIGSGSSGMVYKALFKGQEVAVKFQIASTAENEAVHEENQICRALRGNRHRNIVHTICLKATKLTEEFFPSQAQPLISEALFPSALSSTGCVAAFGHSSSLIGAITGVGPPSGNGNTTVGMLLTMPPRGGDSSQGPCYGPNQDTCAAAHAEDRARLEQPHHNHQHYLHQHHQPRQRHASLDVASFASASSAYAARRRPSIEWAKIKATQVQATGRLGLRLVQGTGGGLIREALEASASGGPSFSGSGQQQQQAEPSGLASTSGTQSTTGGGPAGTYSPGRSLPDNFAEPVPLGLRNQLEAMVTCVSQPAIGLQPLAPSIPRSQSQLLAKASISICCSQGYPKGGTVMASGESSSLGPGVPPWSPMLVQHSSSLRRAESTGAGGAYASTVCTMPSSLLGTALTMLGQEEEPSTAAQAVQSVLLQLGAKPGGVLHTAVMELCEMSVVKAVQRGLLNASPLPVQAAKRGPRHRMSPYLQTEAMCGPLDPSGSIPEQQQQQQLLLQPPEKRAAALQRLLAVARDVCQGMAFLHSLGIVHGDLQPSNVLLVSDEDAPGGYVAKVCDMGCARFVGPAEEGSQGHILGTVGFTAPEAYRGVLVPASDVWSFGCLLSMMLTGVVPHDTLHQAQAIMGVVHGTLDYRLPDWVPPQLAALCASCLAHDRADRPGFAALAARFEELLDCADSLLVLA